MKKLLFLILTTLLLSPLDGQGQGLKGSVLISGAVNYTSQPAPNQQGSEELENSYYSLQPKAGYFVHDRWVLGAFAGYSKSDTDTPVNMSSPGGNYPFLYIGTIASTTWEAGAFARYYHPITQNFYLAGQLNAGYSSTDTEIDLPGFSSGAHLDNTFYFAGASPYLTYLPLPYLGLELGIGEVRYQQGQEDEGKSFTVNLNPNSIKVGVSFYLGRGPAPTAAE